MTSSAKGVELGRGAAQYEQRIGSSNSWNVEEMSVSKERVCKEG